MTVRFYRVALVFVVFQAGLVLLYPWAAVFGELREFGLVAVLAFALPLVVGFVYARARGGFDP